MTANDLFGNEIPDPPAPEEFKLPNGRVVDELTIKAANEETQINAMRSWFFKHFQNPENETPYDSEEGRYVFMQGGPYDAKEQLESRFDGLVPDEVIEKLANELQDESWEWEGRANDDDYILDSIAPPSEHIYRLGASIKSIRNLVKAPVNAAEQQYFLRLLYGNVITALETYLSDRFISSITNNPAALRKFVETFPRFQKESLKLGDIYKKSERLEHRVKTMLVGEVVWHGLIRISKMFKDTFDVDFPEPTKVERLLRSIDIRHDLIHRNGKNKEGVDHVITAEDIEELIVATDALVSHIDAQDEKFNPESHVSTDLPF